MSAATTNRNIMGSPSLSDFAQCGVATAASAEVTGIADRYTAADVRRDRNAGAGAARRIQPGNHVAERIDDLRIGIGVQAAKGMDGCEDVANRQVVRGERRGAQRCVEVLDRKSTRLKSRHYCAPRMPYSA